MSSFTYQPLGDTAVRIQMGSEICPDINNIIRNYCQCLEQYPIKGVTEWIPAYTTVTVFYKPHLIRYHELCVELKQLAVKTKHAPVPPADIITIPILYGGKYGPDIDYVAKYNRLTVPEVISIHSQPVYLIYMLGFVPGFPYLGGMPEQIATPRLETPRAAVPAGSVGIAGCQTGIYPLQTPGGWQLIGQTPLRLYDPDRVPPVLLKAGDYIKFKPVSEE